MEGQRSEPPVDRRIQIVAARQHGVLGRAQLGALGISPGAIDGRLRRGSVVIVHRGVFAPGHAPLTLRGRYMAAVLAGGPCAVLSHRAAAALWGIRPDATPEVTVPRDSRRKREGILIHRSTLDSSEVTILDGIPVTTPGRTLIDLADVLNRRGLERAFDQAEYLRLDHSGLRVIPGRLGSGLLAQVRGEHVAGSTMTRSALEELFLGLCRRHRLPRPEVNVDVEGYLCDFVWRRQRLIVETDGRAAHARRAAFESDRLRDLELTLAGWRPVRLTDRRLKREPRETMRQVRDLLGD